MQRDGLPVAPTRSHPALPGVEEALARLKEAGFLLVVVTNQPDIAPGRASRAVVEAMNDQIMDRLPIDDIRVCAHVNADNCDCRKPKPGLLLEAAKEHAIELSQSWMIGDRWRDVGAGRAAGCRTSHRHDYPEAARPRSRRPPARWKRCLRISSLREG
jgi:D-glycero-D-manno-heptose 1,7-bisphosphate phosphatase